MSNKEKTEDDHSLSLPTSDSVNTLLFDSPAVKHQLPLYIQNMFLACGYDTLNVIADLNVCESESNDIDKMLDYVNKTFPQDQRLAATRLYMVMFITFK